MKILIIEDESSIRNLLIEILKDKYEIADTWNGKEGIKMIGELKPQLVITDFQMPEKNGIEVIEYIRASGLNIKTILMSAEAGHIESMAKAAGTDIVISKPFELEEIINAINVLI